MIDPDVQRMAHTALACLSQLGQINTTLNYLSKQLTALADWAAENTEAARILTDAATALHLLHQASGTLREIAQAAQPSFTMTMTVTPVQLPPRPQPDPELLAKLVRVQHRLAQSAQEPK